MINENRLSIDWDALTESTEEVEAQQNVIDYKAKELDKICALLKCSTEDVVNVVAMLIDNYKELSDKNAKFRP